jgi:glucosyl-dolichyl phosphate glucuronosyltransferase
LPLQNEAIEMKLQIVIPTYNRADMLRRTLTSIINAKKPESMTVGVTVVDNNSKDNTRSVVEEFQAGGEFDLNYIFEPRQGRTFALNTGIKNADCDLLGTIDDDEELADNWIVEVEKVFAERWDKIDFMSGRCLPRFEVEPPEWLPKGYTAIIGKIDCGEDELEFGKNFDGILSGGNSVIKLSVFHEIGLYNESLGRTEKGLLTCDDDEMHHRLLKNGKRGIHNPKMLIYHFVPAERLTKKYHRQWCYGWGLSSAVRDKIILQPPMPEILGVPRHLYGETLRGLLKMTSQYLRLNFNAAFEHELPFWILRGYRFSVKRMKNGEGYNSLEPSA